MTTEEIMQQALNTLEGLFGIHGDSGGVAVWRLGGSSAVKEAITALRSRLEQPVTAPEPQEGAIQDLRTAAQAVVDRWDTPLWKDAPATALYINTLRKVLETTQPAIVPAGWQLVPIEPTQAMLDYADKTVQPVFSIGDEYRAMLAAAPPSPTPPKEPTT